MSRLRQSCGPFFIFAGVMHFVIPKTYEKIMPPYIPAPEAMVYASGVAEIAGGVGMMIPPTRRRAGQWLIATLLAVFPVHVHMVLHPDDFPVPGGERTLKARLPIQGAFIAWVLLAMRPRSRDGASA